MRNDIQKIIVDIKAAARIGHADSMWAALDGLLEFPEVIGNPHMPDLFLTSTVLPIGQALTHPRLQRIVLRQLLNQPDAVLRAIGAVVFAHFHIADEETSDKTLKQLGQDPRSDVRKALSLSLIAAGENSPEQLKLLVQSWILVGSPRLQGVGLQLLPKTNDESFITITLNNYSSNSDPELRDILAQTLAALAEDGQAKAIIAQLLTWTEDSEHFLWVICKTLSRSWTINHVDEALNILERLAAENGYHKQIENTLNALKRHGAEAQVGQALASWQSHSNQNLHSMAEQVLGKQNG